MLDHFTACLWVSRAWCRLYTVSFGHLVRGTPCPTATTLLSRLGTRFPRIDSVVLSAVWALPGPCRLHKLPSSLKRRQDRRMSGGDTQQPIDAKLLKVWWTCPEPRRLCCRRCLLHVRCQQHALQPVTQHLHANRVLCAWLDPLRTPHEVSVHAASVQSLSCA